MDALTLVSVRRDGSPRVWAVVDGRAVPFPPSQVWDSWAAAIPAEPTLWTFSGFDSGRVERSDAVVSAEVLALIS